MKPSIESAKLNTLPPATFRLCPLAADSHFQLHILHIA
eukprot:COSAG02_NODE_39010_length_422_cov_0.712074_1_plen_37_part_10